MQTINAKYFISTAGQRLEGKDSRRLAAFHTAIAAAFSLAVMVLQYVLSVGIGNTSGLSGMSTRSILQTLQTVLQWANMILTPFWNLGFWYVTLLWARDQYARKEDFLTGFYRIGPGIGLIFARSLLVIAVTVICLNLSSSMFLLTPAGQEMEELMLSLGSMDAYYSYMTGMSHQELMAMVAKTTPFMILGCVMSAVLLIPLLYRFRLAEYVILDQKGMRALPAMFISATLMRRRCWQVLKLDLRLWWYYLLKTLCLMLCYLEMILPAVGISLPIGGDGVYFATYILYLAALLAVETAFRPRVQTAYAGVYEAFKEMGPVQKKQVAVKPQDMPWDEQ